MVRRRSYGRVKGVFGLSGTSTYKIWGAMIERCTKSGNNRYAMYGGRGIKVCSRWRDSFVAFLVDMGMRPEGMSLDRIDVNGNYEPGNCKWSSGVEQARNKTNNRMLTHAGKTQCVAAWEDERGFPRGLINQRLGYGWSVDAAIDRRMRAWPKSAPEIADLKERQRLAKRRYDVSEAGRIRHRKAQNRYVERRRAGG